jgi:hypothetical protein
MITAQELQNAPVFLMQSLQADPRLSLAQMTAWLDPLRLIGPDLVDEVYYDAVHAEDPDALALYALSIARRCFPATYCQMARELHTSKSFNQVEKTFCAGIRRVYPDIQLNSLYDMVYGIPLPFMGLDVTSAEFITDHPDYATLLTDYFALTPKEFPSTHWRGPGSAIDDDQFDAIRPIAQRLITSLIAQDRQPYADLAFLLMYLFSCSGNSLVDFSANDYWESGFEPLPWEPEELKMASEACRELVIVLDAAERAMDDLVEDHELRQTLKTNIAALKAAEREKDVRDNIALRWPERPRSRGAQPGTPRETDPQSALVFLRSAFTEAD